MTRLALAAALALAAVAAPSAARAGTCEEDVVAYCVATTCPDYCKAGPKADRAACTATCTADDRCKLTLFGGQDRKDQVELDIQKREQLIADEHTRRRDAPCERFGAARAAAPP